MDKEKELPQRKRLRLQNFDYSSSGAYFITICTKDRKMLFAPVGADSISARMVERTFLETIRQYDGVDSPIYVVMPNHVHLILVLNNGVYYKMRRNGNVFSCVIISLWLASQPKLYFIIINLILSRI
mgnify:CR=1 FL=1